MSKNSSLERLKGNVYQGIITRVEPAIEAAVVKDLGTNWEQALPNRARNLAAFITDDGTNQMRFRELISNATVISPKYTIQGGTREILRGIIARGLGVR